MQFVLALIMIFAFAVPSQVIACGGNQEPQIRQHVRFYPIVGDTTSHWPSEVRAAIGSYASFMVPADTTIELDQRHDGSFSPLTLLDERGAKYIYTSRFLVPAWVDIEHNPEKFKWIHLVASSYGVSEVHMRSSSGWSKTVKFTLIYPSETEQPVKPLVKLALDSGDEKTVRVDGYDNFEVTVAGNVSDGWNASPESETGFKLIRIQQAEKVYYGAPDFKESEPQVKLFFANTRSPKNSTMTLRRGGGLFGNKIQFKIEIMPTPMC